MPLHDLPLQKCGTGHWLTDPCPRGECELLVFGKSVEAAPKVERLEIAREAVEEAVGREAMTNAERQKRWREKQGDKYREWNRERMARKRERVEASAKSASRKVPLTHDPPKPPEE